MLRFSGLIVCCGLAACAAPQPPAPPPPMPQGSAWMAATLDGAPVDRPISLGVSGERVQGQGPCNGYFGAFRAEGTSVAIGPVAATRRACPELDLEQRFFAALTDAATAQAVNGVLTLRDAGGAVVMTLTAAN